MYKNRPQHTGYTAGGLQFTSLSLCKRAIKMTIKTFKAFLPEMSTMVIIR